MSHVVINYGDNEELLINPNCRQLIFMMYLREKCQYDSKASIDLLSELGKLANIQNVDPHDNVKDKFEERVIYIPAMVERSTDDRPTLKMVKPLLTDWEKKFPPLEKKIKILTGELKRKKSPQKSSVDSRGRSTDHRASSSNRSDMGGRSSSIIGGRGSSMNQSGRTSTTGRQSISRKSVNYKPKELEGLKNSTAKGKGSKKK